MDERENVDDENYDEYQKICNNYEFQAIIYFNDIELHHDSLIKEHSEIKENTILYFKNMSKKKISIGGDYYSIYNK